jgi:sugar phosphate isomerase/epimerase
VTLAAFRADVGGRRLADADKLDANITRLREALNLAEECGAEHLIVPAGYVPPADDKNEARARATLTEAAKSLAAIAAHSRTRIAWQAGSEAPEQLSTFLNEIDNAGLFEIDLNPGGLVMRAHDPVKALNALSSRAGVVTAIDHFRGGGETVLGQGDVRWGEVLVGLSAIQRSAPLNVLAGCRVDGDRYAMLGRAMAKLTALRLNPIG